MQDLEKAASKLLESAHKLPHGLERDDVLKEIGAFRLRIDALIAVREQPSAK